MLEQMARNIGTLVLAALLGLSGCVSSESDDESQRSMPDVSYQGSTHAADVEHDNVTALTRAVIGVTGSMNILPGAATSTPATGVGVIAAAELLRAALAKQGPVVAMAGLHPFISVMQECGGGGEIISTTDGGTLTVEYFHCQEDGLTIKGSAQRIGSDDNNTVTIHGIKLTADGLDLSFGGSFSYLDTDTTETLTLADIIIVDNRSGHGSIRAENLVIAQTDVVGGDDITIHGRLYVSDFGHIDVETADVDPLYIADGDDYPSGGLLTLTGQQGETIVIMPLSSTQVNFMVDTDGDTGTEIDETVTWTQVETAIGLP